MFFHNPRSKSTLHGEIRSEEKNWSNLESEEICLCTEAIDHPASDDQSPRGLEPEIALDQEAIDHPKLAIDRPEFGVREFSLPKINQLSIHSDQSTSKLTIWLLVSTHVNLENHE